MQISVCPNCYKEGKLVEGKIINTGSAFGNYYRVYWCKECKDSYTESY
jgi:hypothetical protein